MTKTHGRRYVQFSSGILPVALLVIAIGVNAGISSAFAEDSKPAAKTPAPAKKKLSGAELYAINCNRCHAERYPTEFVPGQWRTLITHMRVRANLPAKQSRAILSYLEAGAGN